MDTDYGSVCSELIESLDYLRPRVKRTSGQYGSFCNLDSAIGRLGTLNHLTANFSKKTQYVQTIRRVAESSSSLIRRKNTERKFSENSVSHSYTALFDIRKNEKYLLNRQILDVLEKPAVKATVIPKTVQTQTTNLFKFKKRKNIAKRVQATVSNQENSIQDNNLFLVLGTQKKALVYELKKSGSLEFINTKTPKQYEDDEVSLDQISSLRLVYDSLNMDKKRDKNRKKAPRKSEARSPERVVISRHVERNEGVRECTCPISVKAEHARDLRSPRSCVRITGRLGLTEDDRYVLRCAASIDDKPVDTEVAGVQFTAQRDEQTRYPCVRNCMVGNCLTEDLRNYGNRNSQADFVTDSTRNVETNFTTQRCEICSCCDCFNCSVNTRKVCATVNKKDRNIQVDLPDERSWERNQMGGSEKTPESLRCQASHGTQVNFDVEFTNTAAGVGSRRSRNDEIIQCGCNNNATTEDQCEGTTSDSECDSNSLKRCPSPMVIITVYPMQKMDGEKVKVVTKATNNKKLFSFERSMDMNKHTNKKPVPINKNERESRSVSKSPNIYRSRSPSPYLRNQSKTNLNENKAFKPVNSRKTSPVRDGVTTLTGVNRHVKMNPSEKPTFDKGKNKSWTKSNRWAKKETKSTTTEHNITKKLIVDNYTKQLTDFLQNNKIKNDCDCIRVNDSNVQVNIDGSDKCYDVTFCQGSRITDYRLKKDDINNEQKLKDSPSLQNLLIIPEENFKNRSVSQDLSDNKQHNEDTFSRLRVRDSLEISHRRGESHPVSAKKTKTPTNDMRKSSKNHYRGDSCALPDPVKRDQEIRALLGIDKGWQKFTNMANPVNNIKAQPARCFCEGICDRNYNDRVNTENHLESCVCTDITNAMKSSGRVINAEDTTHPRLLKMTCECKSSINKHKSCECSMSKAIEKDQETSLAETDLNHLRTKNANAQIQCSLESMRNSSSGKDVQCECSMSSSYGNSITKKASSKSISKASVLVNTKSTQHNDTLIPQTSLYQQLILNRNIQVFLQVEQFSKQKPIVLSRKQYNKVKKTIEKTIISNRSKRKTCICKTSLLSLGEVKRKTNHRKSNLNKKTAETQRASVSEGSTNNAHEDSKQQNAYYSFPKKQKFVNEHGKSPRKMTSAIEFRSSSQSCTKYMTFSSTNVEVGTSASRFGDKSSPSLHTIFKGRRKCFSPNLGSSVYSLNSEEDIISFERKKTEPIESKKAEPATETKTKKSFLRRLMSCLIIPSAKVTNVNPVINMITQPPNKPSVSTCFDAYRINSPFYGMAVSPMYDTSVSFYSNHRVHPVKSKIKRGFFKSVREFLSIRKSQSVKMKPP